MSWPLGYDIPSLRGLLAANAKCRPVGPTEKHFDPVGLTEKHRKRFGHRLKTVLNTSESSGPGPTAHSAALCRCRGTSPAAARALAGGQVWQDT